MFNSPNVNHFHNNYSKTYAIKNGVTHEVYAIFFVKSTCSVGSGVCHLLQRSYVAIFRFKYAKASCMALIRSLRRSRSRTRMAFLAS